MGEAWSYLISRWTWQLGPMVVEVPGLRATRLEGESINIMIAARVLFAIMIVIVTILFSIIIVIMHHHHRRKHSLLCVRHDLEDVNMAAVFRCSIRKSTYFQFVAHI